MRKCRQQLRVREAHGVVDRDVEVVLPEAAAARDLRAVAVRAVSGGRKAVERLGADVLQFARLARRRSIARYCGCSLRPLAEGWVARTSSFLGYASVNNLFGTDTYAFAFFTASVSTGNTASTSPTMP